VPGMRTSKCVTKLPGILCSCYLETQESRFHCEGRRPLVLQNIQTDCPRLRRYIRMPYCATISSNQRQLSQSISCILTFCDELHFGRVKWVVRGDPNVHFEDSSIIRRAIRTFYSLQIHTSQDRNPTLPSKNN
jgi:hypothetical protein